MEMFILPQDFNFFDPPGKAVAGSLETSSINGLTHRVLRSSEKGVSRLLPSSPVLPPPPSLPPTPPQVLHLLLPPLPQPGGTKAPYGKRPEPRPQNGVRNGVLTPGLQRSQRGCGCRNRTPGNGGRPKLLNPACLQLSPSSLTSPLTLVKDFLSFFRVNLVQNCQELTVIIFESYHREYPELR